MKLIGNLLCIGFVIWIASFFVKAEKKEFPSNEELLSQFERLGVLDRNEWKKGNIVNGIQVYTAKTKNEILNNVWSLGTKDVGVISLSNGDDLAMEGIAALGECYKVAKGVIGLDSKENFNAVAAIFREASATRSEDGIYQSSGVIDGKNFDVRMQRVTPNIFSFSCIMERS